MKAKSDAKITTVLRQMIEKESGANGIARIIGIIKKINIFMIWSYLYAKVCVNKKLRVKSMNEITARFPKNTIEIL